ncbi:hypothetical protein [Luteimonas fraxinea]|uniref:hypothetical protein n=1 Tax=Luteimonas fraxinea TaxID=2901869 RepID=UPI001E4ED50D|nr:hypothetical protein [Luteimonas fraxinea]MCD9124385.1 hypothetical protein [Luteimonas fraxinea]
MRLLRSTWPFGIIISSVALVFWAGLGGGFLFDDYPNLVYDIDWRLDSLEVRPVIRTMFQGISSASGRPLAMLSFGLNHIVSGVDPWAMKLTNVAWHAVNATLVFAFCRQLLLLTSRIHPRGSVVNTKVAALAITLAWALHPLQVSSVLYIIQRMELGASTGVLLAMICYVHARKAGMESQSAWRWWVASAAAFALGIGFKESALLAPLFTLLLEVFLLRFKGPETISRPLVVIYLTGLAGALLAFALIVVPHYATAVAYSSRNFTLYERLLTQAPVLAMYLKQIVWPLPHSLLFYYDDLAPVRSMRSAGFLLPALLLSALATISMAVRNRWPLIGFGIAWFFAAHALTSNVVPLELAFEHRNYLALLGPVLALAVPLSWFGSRFNADTRTVMSMLPAATLGTLCIIHAASWGEPMRLAITLASRNVDSPRAGIGLATRLIDEARGDPASPAWSLAKAELENAAAANSDSAIADATLLAMDLRAGIISPPAQWNAMRAKLARHSLAPEDVNALYALNDARIRGGKAGQDEELLQTFVAVLTLNPDSAVLHAMYGNFAWNVARDQQLAIAMSREAVRLDPSLIEYRVGLTRFLLSSDGRIDAAEVDRLFRDINAANAHGQHEKALDELRRLRAARPSDERMVTPRQNEPSSLDVD